MSDHEQTQRLGSGHDQDPTRRLSTYEERDYTQRLEVPPAPPWDPEDPPRPRDWQAEERRREKRQWPTALVVVFALIGLLLGVLGTLLVTGPSRAEIAGLQDQLSQAQEAIDTRDQRIADLERELEDMRNSPIPGVPLPDLQLPDNVPLPSGEQGRELLDQLRDGVRDFVEQELRQRLNPQT